MKSSRALTLVVALELLVLCICVALAALLASGILGALSLQIAAAPRKTSTSIFPPTWTATATAVPVTDTPAPTNTRVLPTLPADITFVPVTPAPTRSALSASTYNIVVPTPTAPPLLYRVSFDSNFQVVTYTVAGQTTSDLRKSLDVQALPDPNEAGGRYYARTDWFLSARWFTAPTARGCEVDSGTVTLAMTMTLPMLSTTQGMAPDVMNRWTTFISNTITHETGHVTLSMQGARDYQRDLG
ncbi:MAG: DUF922 domain-containing protein, partial [Chloroflexota bacterium]|nr:DUF922 domain-containing protein [Chloroflexota bacterium]